MTPIANNVVDPSACSCFRGSYQYTILSKIKWSTLSIGTALLIIIVYLSSGLHALVDVTTIMSKQPFNSDDDAILWPLTSSSLMTIYGWISVAIYFTVVLLVILLLTGIQLEKSCLLFLWSIIMIFMLLADGSVTVLSLREHQKQKYRPEKQIKILFFVLSVRLIVSLCGIFVTIFHFRRLIKAQSDHINRQRMLERYHSGSPSPSYHDSWARSAAFSNTPKDINDDGYVADHPPVTLPRAKVAIVPYHPTATMYHSYNQQSEYIAQSEQRVMKRYNDDFRYNIPLQERFHQQEIKNMQQY